MSESMNFAGFLSLEEIDETEYNLDIPRSCEQKPFVPNGLEEKERSSDVNGSIEGESDEKLVVVAEEKEKSKKKKKKKDRKNGSIENANKVNESVNGKLLHLLSLD